MQNNEELVTVPPQEGEENAVQEEENAVQEEDDGEGVPDDNKWMDWDDKGISQNPKYHRKFAGFIGKVARRHVPINYPGWKIFQKENKRTTEKMWEQIKV